MELSPSGGAANSAATQEFPNPYIFIGIICLEK
jgi:hypothetical protein